MGGCLGIPSNKVNSPPLSSSNGDVDVKNNHKKVSEETMHSKTSTDNGIMSTRKCPVVNIQDEDSEKREIYTLSE